jgi:hypothetical protein
VIEKTGSSACGNFRTSADPVNDEDTQDGSSPARPIRRRS